MSAPNPRAGTTGRNPGPRAALHREGGEPDGALIVARPGSGPAGDETSQQGRRIRIAPAPAPDKRTATKEAKKPSGKKQKGSKKEKKQGKKHGPPLSDLVPAELTVPLPKPLRRALAQAATERDVTPELLVAQVLSEWLDH